MRALFITDGYNQSLHRMERLHNKLKELNQNQYIKFLSWNVVLLDLDTQSNILGELIHLAIYTEAQHQVVYLPNDAVIFDYYKSQDKSYSVEFD